MTSRSGETVETVMEALVRHLIQNPDSKDTTAGVRWWLDSPAQVSDRTLRAAVQQLIARRWLVVRGQPRLLCLAPGTLPEMEAWLDLRSKPGLDGSSGPSRSGADHG